MGEYEDRYPDAFGRGEEVDTPKKHRHFLNRGLPRQVRDHHPAAVDEPQNPERPQDLAPPPLPPPMAPIAPRADDAAPPRPAPAPHPAGEIREDIYEQLTVSPFIDASDIAISVDGAEVTLDGTLTSLIGIVIALAKALPDSSPGAGRLQVRLRVRPVTRGFATEPGDAVAGLPPGSMA